MTLSKTAKVKTTKTKKLSNSADANTKTEAAPKRKRRQYMPAEQRRKQILQTAREVFSTSGLKGARTRELAQAAGINQATLFEHFSSKEELFLASVVEPLVELVEGQRERTRHYQEAESLDDLVAMLTAGMKLNLENTIEIYPLLVQALFSDQELGKKLYRDHIEPLLAQRAETMEGMVKRDIAPDLIQLASLGIFFAVAMEKAMTGKKRNLDEVASQLTDLILFGSSVEPHP